MNIVELVKIHGVENVFITIGCRPMRGVMGVPFAFTSSSDDEVMVETTINEDRYKISDEYKIAFNICEADGLIFSPRAEYISDFNWALRNGHVKVRVRIPDTIA